MARGFTLVEACVSAALVAALVGLAVPAMSELAQAVRLRAQAQHLLATLHLVRSEAIRRNGRVAMCKSADGRSCASAGGWEQGLIVFEDADQDGERGPGEALLHRDDALPPEYRATGNGTVRDAISYAPAGVARTPGGAFQAGTISVCRRSPGRTEAWQVVLNAGGRPRAQKVWVPTCA